MSANGPIFNTAFASTDTDSKVVSPSVTGVPVVYHGFSVKETGGSTATFNIEERNSADTLQRILDVVNLSSGESAREFYGEGMPLRAGNSIYLNVLTGAWNGVLRFSDGIEV